ncbi:MAG: hypothetical protein M1608_16310 [Candidatus Omnitrophica bacterium]|nr:hypothetical protein [Candidatus Omnitrophota bacterium]
MKAWKVILAVLVIFCAGAVTGSLSLKLYENQARQKLARRVTYRGPGWNQRIEFMHRLEQELDLTPDQHERIERILRKSQERISGLWDQIAPQVHDEFRSAHEQIRGELTADQKKVFDVLAKRGHGRIEPHRGAFPPSVPPSKPPVESSLSLSPEARSSRPQTNSVHTNKP